MSALPQQPARIPLGFQYGLALYILLTGAIPTIIQAASFGVQGGGSDAFLFAMASELGFEILLIVPLFMLSRHPLGILHPLVLAVIVWPIVMVVPSVVGVFGGWGGVLSGAPVDTPYYYGLPGRSGSVVWMATAKANAVRFLSLIFIYVGFFVNRGSVDLSRRAGLVRNPASIRAVMMVFVAISVVILLFFVRSRGGLNEHLTSLGGGRFTELSQFGPLIVAIQVGAIALWVWIAAVPSDVKSPLFLATLALVLGAEFVSNGSRSGGIEVPMAVGLIWALRTHKIPWRTALLLAPLLFLLIGVLGAIRTSSWRGSDASAELSKADWSGSFKHAQKELTERRAENADVPIFERGMALSNGPLLGYSYAAAIVAPIPRTIWKTKPRGAGSLYAQLFLGASFEGTTIPLRPETEMYWNFGLVGVVVMSMIYGFLLRSAYYFFFRRYPDPFATVFYYLFITTFTFASSRLVPFEQRISLLFICYLVTAAMVRGSPANLTTRYVSSRPQPAHP